MGKKLHQEVGAVGFGEYSALTHKVLKEAFNMSIPAVFEPVKNETKERTKKPCLIM
jgi:hypothetical protein